MKSPINESDFLLLLQSCEDKCVQLLSLNDKHLLLQFSNQFTSANKYKQLHQRVVRHFLPGVCPSNEAHPTFEEVMAAYGHFCLALDTAICIEQSKNSLRQN